MRLRKFFTIIGLRKIISLCRNLKISARLTILLGVALAAVLMVALTGMVNNKRLADCVELTYEAITRPLAAVADARGEFNAMRATLYDLAHDFNTLEENSLFRRQLLRNLTNYEENILAYKSILKRYPSRDPYENEAVDYLYSQLTPLRLYVENIANLGVQTGRGADAILILRGDFLKTADDISLDLANLTRILEAQTESAHIYADSLRLYNDRLSFIIATLGAILLFLIAWIIVESIIRPLEKMSRAARHFSTGDLKFKMKYRAKDEIGILVDSFRQAAGDLAAHLRDKETAERAAHKAELARGTAEAANLAIVSSIKYAAKIQNNLRPADEVFRRAFRDHHIIWKPRDIVGGDIYWMKNFDSGAILCVCDCTGHGTPGALLTMLVVSALESAVKESNFADPRQIMCRLDQRLAAVLHIGHSSSGPSAVLDFTDGCDIAIVFVAHDGFVRVSSSGIPVFVCDGQKVSRIRGRNLRVGEGRILTPDKVKVTDIAPNPDNKFYIASDGLFDQIGGEPPRPFGYQTFTDIILARHSEGFERISRDIWRAFENHRGGEARRDDVELIAFMPETEVENG